MILATPDGQVFPAISLNAQILSSPVSLPAPPFAGDHTDPTDFIKVNGNVWWFDHA